MSKRSEIYVSIDVEADGPIPGRYSMLSLGAAAFSSNGDLHSTFSVNLVRLGEAQQEGHPDTMAWWAKHPKAWEICRKDPLPSAIAMLKFYTWLTALPGKPVFVGYPASYDFLFVYWYLIRFNFTSPFSFSALDIKTMAMTMLGTDFHSTSKKTMPKCWFGDEPHTHEAVQDAIGQGRLFCNILRESRERLTLGP